MIEYIMKHNPNAILWDGLDDAIIGLTPDNVVVYSIEKMKRIFIDRDGMNEEEALEWIDYNILCAYVGEYTPIHIYQINF